MKTFKQFSEQAYSQAQLVENPILNFASDQVNKIKNIPSNIDQTVKSLRKDPVGTLRRGGSASLRGLRGLSTAMVKGQIGREATQPIKNLTGNNPAINFALDTATDIASYRPGWRSAARTILPKLAKPLALASAGILATPTAVADGTLTGAQRRELEQRRRKNPDKMGPAY